MKRTLAVALATIGLFVAGALIAYAIGSNFAEVETVSAPPTLPEYEDPIPVLEPVPISGDPWEHGVRIAQQLNAVREAATEAGVTLEAAGITSSPVAGSRAAGADSLVSLIDPSQSTIATIEDGDTTTTTSAVGAEGTAEGSEGPARASDICIIEDAAESCPEGEPGVVLGIKAMPAMSVFLTADPYPTGVTGIALFWPRCDFPPAAENTAYLGVSLNRPANVTITYRPRAGGPDSTYSFSTSPEQNANWLDWLEDESAGFDDPRLWIYNCITITDLEPGEYWAWVHAEDPADPTVNHSIAMAHPGYFEVSGVSTPPRTKPPTRLTTVGLEELYVVAARRESQEVAVRAVDGGRSDATCDTGGDASSIDSRFGHIGDDPIDEERLADPEYRYLPEFNVLSTHRLTLRPGARYLICVYWLNAFGAPRVQLAEQFGADTPPAYLPELELIGFTNLFGTQTGFNIQVHHPDCDFFFRVYNFEGPFQSERRVSPEPLCSIETGLNALFLDGVPITTTVWDQQAGEPRETRRSVRLGVRCPAIPCPERPDEIVLIPLPDVVTERRLCGSGWGSGCDDEIPMRSAGEAMVRISYRPVDAVSMDGWALTEPSEFTDTSLDESVPVLTVEETDYISWSEQGAQATLTITADRPVTLEVVVSGDGTSSEPCIVGGGPDPYRETTHTTTHIVIIDGLCPGKLYRLGVSGEDESGSPAGIFRGRGSPLVNYHSIIVPPLRGVLAGTVTVQTPDDGWRHSVRQDVWAHAGTALFWPVTAVPGWHTPYRHTSCQEAEALSDFVRVAEFPVSVTSAPYLSVDVQLYRNLRSGDVNTCEVGDLLDRISFTGSLEISELVEGVTVTSPGGTIQAHFQLVDLDP